MIIQFAGNVAANEKEDVKSFLSSHGYSTREVVTQGASYLVCVGSKELDIRKIGNMSGVNDVHRVEDDQKLVSRKWKVEPTVVNINGSGIGGGELTIIAGPCSIENSGQVARVASFLKENGVNIMRGGVFKPRSSPYSFRGVGLEGLRTFHQICSSMGIKVITEVMDHGQIDDMYEFVDIFQVGARNSQNFTLLDAMGKLDKPVLLKRGLSGTIDELLYSAEYIFSGGNERIILCERGIRTYEKSYRNTLDINAIALLKKKSHLPVIVDPSHGTGIRSIVREIALAGLMAGADGIMVEIHETPAKAISDAFQTLDLNEAERLFSNARDTWKFRKTLSLPG
jgi:3-deoxy-7-phosphoheptulonate synthase